MTTINNMSTIKFLKALKSVNDRLLTESEFTNTLAEHVAKDCRETGIIIPADMYVMLKNMGLDKTHILLTLIANGLANGGWVLTDPDHIALCVTQNAKSQRKIKTQEYICVTKSYYDVACVINK